MNMHRPWYGHIFCDGMLEGLYLRKERSTTKRKIGILVEIDHFNRFAVPLTA